MITGSSMQVMTLAVLCRFGTYPAAACIFYLPRNFRTPYERLLYPCIPDVQSNNLNVVFGSTD